MIAVQFIVRITYSLGPINASHKQLQVTQGPNESPHAHPPNREECASEKLVSALKRKAEEHPHQRPGQLLRTELQGVSVGVLSKLPEQPALVRTIQRVKRKNMPATPNSLADLLEIPQTYQKALVGEQFLLYDSGSKEEEEEDEEGPRRVLVFTTRKNIELLCKCSMWFVDGTFKTSPSIFAQIFVIMGLRRRVGSEEEVAIPLVYCLLSGKEQSLREHFCGIRKYPNLGVSNKSVT